MNVYCKYPQKNLVSSDLTDTYILKSYGISSLFLDFIKDFCTLSIQKSFYKNVCLPTNPKNIGDITGNKTFFLLA